MYSRKLITNTTLIKYILQQNKIAYNSDDIEDHKFEKLKEKDTQSLNYLHSPFGNMFNNIDDNYYRLGMLHQLKINGKKINVSLYCSILTITIDMFLEKTLDQKIVFLTQFINKLLYDVNNLSLFKKFNYRSMRWKKKQLFNSIKLCDNTDILLQFLSDYFDINIFVFDLDIARINVIYTEEKMNRFKKNIFLIHYNNIFEPIYHNKNNIFDYKSYLFNFLITKKKKLLNALDINYLSNKIIKTFLIEKYPKKKQDDGILDSNIDDFNIDENTPIVFNNDYDELSEEGNQTNDYDLNDSIDTEIDVNKQDDSTDIFYKKENIIKKQINIKLSSITLKMSLKELQNIASSLKINLGTGKFTQKGKEKLKTKSILYNEIIKCL